MYVCACVSVCLGVGRLGMYTQVENPLELLKPTLRQLPGNNNNNSINAAVRLTNADSFICQMPDKSVHP